MANPQLESLVCDADAPISVLELPQETLLQLIELQDANLARLFRAVIFTAVARIEGVGGVLMPSDEVMVTAVKRVLTKFMDGLDVL
jgi:hypothetical protein